MSNVSKGCQKSNPIPNKIINQKGITKSSSIPFQLDTLKHGNNQGLSQDLCFFIRAKTSELGEEKII